MPLTAEQVRQNFEAIKDEVAKNDGLKSYVMGALRDAVGAGRLDYGPINQIKVNLERCGLASTEMEREQTAHTLIYDPHRPLGRLIRACAGDQADSDAQVRRALTDVLNDPATNSPAGDITQERDALRDTLLQVRALVSGVN